MSVTTVVQVQQESIRNIPSGSWRRQLKAEFMEIRHQMEAFEKKTIFSQRLLEWYNDFSTANPAETTESTFVKAKLAELRNTVLVSPITDTPLITPYVVINDGFTYDLMALTIIANVLQGKNSKEQVTHFTDHNTMLVSEDAVAKYTLRLLGNDTKPWRILKFAENERPIQSKDILEAFKTLSETNKLIIPTLKNKARKKTIEKYSSRMQQPPRQEQNKPFNEMEYILTKINNYYDSFSAEESDHNQVMRLLRETSSRRTMQHEKCQEKREIIQEQILNDPSRQELIATAIQRKAQVESCQKRKIAEQKYDQLIIELQEIRDQIEIFGKDDSFSQILLIWCDQFNRSLSRREKIDVEEIMNRFIDLLKDEILIDPISNTPLISPYLLGSDNETYDLIALTVVLNVLLSEDEALLPDQFKDLNQLKVREHIPAQYMLKWLEKYNKRPVQSSDYIEAFKALPDEAKYLIPTSQNIGRRRFLLREKAMKETRADITDAVSEYAQQSVNNLEEIRQESQDYCESVAERLKVIEDNKEEMIAEVETQLGQIKLILKKKAEETDTLKTGMEETENQINQAKQEDNELEQSIATVKKSSRERKERIWKVIRNCVTGVLSAAVVTGAIIITGGGAGAITIGTVLVKVKVSACKIGMTLIF